MYRAALNALDRYVIDGRELGIVFAKDKRKTPQEMRQIEAPRNSRGGSRDRDRGGRDRDRGGRRDFSRDRRDRDYPPRDRPRDSYREPPK